MSNLLNDYTEYTTGLLTSTITLAGLTNGSVRQGTVLDFTTANATDWALYLKLLLASGTVSGPANIWLAPLAPNGSDYADGAANADAAFTATSLRNAILVASAVVASAASSIIVVPSLRRFCTTLPPKAVPLVQNSTGVAFGSGGANFELGAGPIFTGA